VATPAAEEIVRARGLTRVFGATRAVDGIDLAVRRGECFGFLGPNGAGKTTTVSMIQGFTPLTSGELRVLGLDIQRQAREVKAQLGVCPQENNLDEEFTVERNLLTYARYFDIPVRIARARAAELLRFFGLAEQSGHRLSTLSGGMKRRLVLARALINSPRLLILDEPTTGLDPQARHQIWSRLRSLRETGTTIVITTHYMEEAAQLCDRLVIMDHGRILVEGRPRELVERTVGGEMIEIWDADDELAAAVREGGLQAEPAGDRLYVPVRGDHRAGDTTAAGAGVAGTARSAGGDASSLSTGEEIRAALARRFPEHQVILRNATLEDVFMALTGRELRE
jgi:lipooligosaccharide transport system ATP-binding protein